METKIKGNPTGETKAMGGIQKKRVATIGEDNALNSEVIELLRGADIDVFPLRTLPEADVFCRQNKNLDLVIHFLPPKVLITPATAHLEVKEEVKLEDNTKEENNEVQSNVGEQGLNSGDGESTQ